MSSDMFIFDGSSFFNHSSPAEEVAVSSGADLFLSDELLSPFSDSAMDILQAYSDHNNQQNPVEESHSLDQISSSILSSSSPPSHQLQSLNLYHHYDHHQSTTAATQLQNQNQNLPNGFGINFSGLDAFHVKTEECQMGFENNGYYNNTNNNNYGTCGLSSSSSTDHNNVTKYIQRSLSSNSFDGSKPCFLFSPLFDSLTESPNFHHHQALSSPEIDNGFLTGQMRRVCSTGDLQNFGTARTTQRSFSSPLASESSFMEEANNNNNNFKVGRYSAEERKEKISKYRAKRTLRNFNKTIKYACRKTLADNRPRIRGRFARNDEPGEIPKTACSFRDEDEENLWVCNLHICTTYFHHHSAPLEELHEEEEDMNGTVLRSGQFVMNNGTYNGSTQFQYYGF
ncbi:hypothetical protein F8388_023479 [Cannabis sativa]|uniref:CCT domain-containing protein n=1 Tax=Cannabis sativa TaxID=3483 RepID=A0A7J6ERW1_CANSA|nr:hypothetical protein F8388_023479 [Cannabis sativa]